MDLESPLKRGITQCRHEAKRWLALVVFTLATFVITIGINAMRPSPELQQAASLLAAASVMAIICSLFGFKQCLNSSESIQYGLSAFRDLRQSLKVVESEKADLQKALQQLQSSYLMLLLDFESATCDKAKLQKELDATKQRLEDTRDELASAGYVIESIRNGFCQAKKNAEALQDKIATTEQELEDAYNNLDSAYDMLRDKSVAVDKALQNAETLQDRLNTARRISVRRLIERNELQDQNDGLRKELHEAKMDLEWSRGLRADAKEQAASLENILKNLDEATEIADLREKLKMVINRLSSEDSRE